MGDLQKTSAEGTQTSAEGTQQGGKTFTQDDVNRIVQERLAKEKGKASSNEDFEKKTAELERKQAELLEKENRLNALTALRSAGYPDELADVIRCSNADELKKSMELIDKIIKERTPSEQDKENEANKAAFAFTMPMQNSSVKDDVRAAMGLRG